MGRGRGRGGGGYEVDWSRDNSVPIFSLLSQHTEHLK